MRDPKFKLFKTQFLPSSSARGRSDHRLGDFIDLGWGVVILSLLAGFRLLSDNLDYNILTFPRRASCKRGVAHFSLCCGTVGNFLDFG